MHFPEGIVYRRVEGAGRYQHARLRNRLIQFQPPRQLGGGLHVFGLKQNIQIDRMVCLLAIGGDLPDAFRQRLHRAKSLLIYGIVCDEKAQTLLSGMDPNPFPVRPTTVRTIQFTFGMVARSNTVPPNLIGTR
jgi:hypothetical protein